MSRGISYTTESEIIWAEMSQAFGRLYGGIGIEDPRNNVTGQDPLTERSCRQVFVEAWFAAKYMDPPKYQSVGGNGALYLAEDGDE